MELASKPINDLDDLLRDSPQKARMVTRQDGSQVPFSDLTLTQYLEDKLEGLNKQYMDLSLIVNKVKQGIYNGKCKTSHCRHFGVLETCSGSRSRELDEFDHRAARDLEEIKILTSLFILF